MAIADTKPLVDEACSSSGCNRTDPHWHCPSCTKINPDTVKNCSCEA
nr:uncharacterized protein CTRU02_05460 [Colletotrichum truncatum]KAF6793903.1 hypothetical protein CTRU02_05460 [Colletotrichum truncatum]